MANLQPLNTISEFKFDYEVREDIKEFFKSRNYTLIIDRNINNFSCKAKYICCCGTQYDRTIKDVKKTLMCKICKNKKENNIQNTEKIIDNIKWIRVDGGWVSEDGRAKNVYDLTLTIQDRGRVYINKCKQKLNILIAKAFKLTNYEKLDIDKTYKIIHIDGDVSNNNINNLIITNEEKNNIESKKNSPKNKNIENKDINIIKQQINLIDDNYVELEFIDSDTDTDLIEVKCETTKNNYTYNFEFLFNYIDSSNYLNIPTEISTELYKNLNNETFKNDLLNWCVQNIKIPDNIISFDKCLKDLNNYNKSINTEIINNVIVANNVGNTFLNYYVLKDLLNSTSRKYNFIKYWNTPELKKNIICRTLINLQPKTIVFNSFIQSYGYMYNKVNNFPANVARSIYNKYGGKNVLDFCSGFGGRLLGFWNSNCEKYIGIDPNKNINYMQILNKLKTNCPKNKDVKIYRKCAEELDFKSFNTIFDCVFTSPPYYNLEVYTNDNTQSYNKYPQYNDWLNNFLWVCLNKSIEVLKSGGYLIINIKNIKKYNIADDMNNYLSTIKSLQRLPDIEMVQARRFYKKSKELLYVYQKL
jgi:hypothetical protein